MYKIVVVEKSTWIRVCHHLIVHGCTFRQQISFSYRLINSATKSRYCSNITWSDDKNCNYNAFLAADTYAGLWRGLDMFQTRLMVYEDGFLTLLDCKTLDIISWEVWKLRSDSKKKVKHENKKRMTRKYHELFKPIKHSKAFNPIWRSPGSSVG